MTRSAVIGTEIHSNDRFLLRAMAVPDPEEPFDLRRHEWQLSAVKPPLANSA